MGPSTSDGNVEEREQKGGTSSKPRDKVEPQLQSPAVISLMEAISAWLLWLGLKPDLFDPLPHDTTTH